MTTTWWEGRMLAFDLETTGVDYESARIVTAAVAAVGGGEETLQHGWVVNPGVEIPEGAARVHGYTTARAQDEGRPAREAIGEILTVLEGYVRDGVPIVAFNARYDLTVIDREARRYELDPLVERVGITPVYVIDPAVIDRRIDRFRKGRRKLENLCTHYGATLDDAHEAFSDAVAAARLAYRLGQRTPELGALELEELHEAQIEWAAFQAEGLQEYFRRTRPDAFVEPRWPLVPFELAEVL